jgi:hypothetical protein
MERPLAITMWLSTASYPVRHGPARFAFADFVRFLSSVQNNLENRRDPDKYIPSTIDNR